MSSVIIREASKDEIMEIIKTHGKADEEFFCAELRYNPYLDNDVFELLYTEECYDTLAFLAERINSETFLYGVAKRLGKSSWLLSRCTHLSERIWDTIIAELDVDDPDAWDGIVCKETINKKIADKLVRRTVDSFFEKSREESLAYYMNELFNSFADCGLKDF